MTFQLIESLMHGKVLTVSYPEACAPIRLWSHDTGPRSANDRFMLQLIDQQRFWIRSAVDMTMVLDVEGARRKGGTKVILYPCSYPPTPNQLWRWDGDMIKSCLGDFVLDVEGGQTHNGAQLIIWEPKYGSYNDNQRWRLVFQ